MVRSKTPGPLGVGLPGPRRPDVPGVTGLRDDAFRGFGGEDTPGTLGTNDSAAATALLLDDGDTKGAASSKQKKLVVKVSVIEFPKQSIFSSSSRKSIVADLEAELKRISKSLPKSKARFSVSWDQPSKLSAAKLTPTVLQVYVIDSSQKVLDQALKILDKAFGVSDEDAQKFGKHLSAEGGVNFKRPGGLVSLSFCSVARIEQYKKSGIAGLDKMFANLILHEIGHGMDADHADGGVMAAKQVYDSRGGVNFRYAKPSIDNIDGFLSRI